MHRYQVITDFYRNDIIGINIAYLGKSNGTKGVELLDIAGAKDIVLSTDEAIKFLRSSRPVLEVHTLRLDQSG